MKTATVENGKTYLLRHSRFGCATVIIERQDPEWVDVTIVNHQLVGMRDAWLTGDTKTVRRSHCTFEEVAP